MRFRTIAVLICLALPPIGLAKESQLGQEVFRAKCIGCHAISCNRSGPRLGGIIGRKVGSLADFKGYSDQMKAAGFVWSRKQLDKFLSDPNKMIPGTLMAYAGKLADSDDRKNVIDFLVGGDKSLDLCF